MVPTLRKVPGQVRSRAATMLAVICGVVLTSCGEREYTWAFAQNMDGSFHENELCRETLAETIYASQTRDRIEATNLPNVFIYRGTIETYRIYAFHDQAGCEAALTGMKLRRS
jgi:hypothetical protein